jgi:glutathione S-transferase
MADLTLIVGNKNYSSWSLRPYVALKQVGVPFDEVVVPLQHVDTAARIAHYSPAGRVPVLRHGDITVWESLAICEYLAETFPVAELWPSDRAARAAARTLATEMHAGFAALRNACPMNIRREDAGGRTFDAAVTKDIARIQEIWRDCREKYGAGGPFLFGKPGNIDAMYAPVVTRFRTYGVPMDDVSAAYAGTVWDMPAMQEWIDAARKEPWALEDSDSA